MRSPRTVLPLLIIGHLPEMLFEPHSDAFSTSSAPQRTLCLRLRPVVDIQYPDTRSFTVRRRQRRLGACREVRERAHPRKVIPPNTVL